MRETIDLAQPARLTWQDLSKVSTGVTYLRGSPCFEGTLQDAIRLYKQLPRTSQASAHIYLGSSGDKPALKPADIEKLAKRRTSR